MSLAFIACVENGYLDDQTVLLCLSIRRFAGRFRDVPIHTFEPRAGTKIRSSTLISLQELGCIHHRETLNVEFEAFPHTNKIFTSAYAEQILQEDLLVFVDSDTLFTGEPRDLELAPEFDAAALPVNNCRLGSTGFGDANEPYWQRMYDICGVGNRPFVTGVTDGVRIRAYFNSGLIVVRRVAGLFSQWLKDFMALVAAGHISSVPGMDDFSLAAMMGRAFAKVQVLDLRYNYPLTVRQRPLLPMPFRAWQLDDMIHVHYRYWLTHPDFLNLLVPPLDENCSIVCWLRQFLPLRPLHPAFQPSIQGLGTRDGHDTALPLV